MLSSTSLPKLLMNGEKLESRKIPKTSGFLWKKQFFWHFCSLRSWRPCYTTPKNIPLCSSAHNTLFSRDPEYLGQISKTDFKRNFQKNRQILLLRISKGPKYHVFESISGRRHAFLMRVEANTIYSMSSIYSQNLMSGFPQLASCALKMLLF